VYLFRDRNGDLLYVGKAKDVRARVKSYFYGDERKKVQDLVASVTSIEAIETRSELEALVVEIRLIARHLPRFNAQGKRWQRFAYLKVDMREAWPRVKVARAVHADDGVVYIGPFGSSARATLAKEALEEAFAIRRCTRSMGRATRFAPCALADMGRCLAPCDGRTDAATYEALVQELRRSIAEPGAMLTRLVARMDALAARERFEEAALARDRIAALADVLARMRLDRWLTAGTVALADADGRAVRLVGGALEHPHPAVGDAPPIGWPPPRERADELAVVRSWVRRHPARVVACDRPPHEPVDGGAELAAILERLRAARDEPAPRDRRGGRPRTRR
jgi:DNA polymerase-3 subunit epsilon